MWGGGGGGASSPGQSIFTPWGGEGDKLPRVRGIPRGIFTPEGRHCTKAALLPVWGGGRGKLPRIQDKPVHRFGMVFFFCTHCSLVLARIHVYFYILVLRKG